MEQSSSEVNVGPIDNDADSNVDSSNEMSENGTETESENGSETESENGTGTESENEHVVRRQPSLQEWLTFNNKVTSMRPLFKRAKIQFINKTTRLMKKYREKKGTPEQRKKNQKKADRLANEIKIINELEKDVIPRFVLLHSQEEIAAILNSAESTMAHRVKAKIALMPMVLEVAQSFQAALPGWKESLFKSIQTSGKKMKRKRRKMRKRGEHSKSQGGQQVSNGVRIIGEECESRFQPFNFPLPSDLENDSGGMGDSSDENEEINVMLRAIPNLNTEPVLKSDNNNEECRQTLNSKTEAPNLKRALSSDDELSSTEVENGPSCSYSEPSGSSTQTRPPLNVDPFFITADNKEYKTHWKIESAEDIQRQNQAKKKKEIPILLKRLTHFDELTKKGKSSSKTSGTVHSKPRNITKSSNETKPKLESLHPSWQAKKKLNTNVVQFEGKKIVFDD